METTAARRRTASLASRRNVVRRHRYQAMNGSRRSSTCDGRVPSGRQTKPP